ncbi:MAG TPA: cytochrome c-type biogenesis protein CcmH [Gemmatimonadaceae bacterium]|nr:cytochrome c-type biogenesis protein CcmH [Gemmatimonadaceae bacterium]
MSREPGAPISRRAFLARTAGHGAAAAVGAAAGLLVADVLVLGAQQPDAPQSLDSANLFAMNQTASRPVRLPPKPGARPSMTNDARDELEHHIRCQCGCTLDVYTCRTTDFSCQVSPAMHADVMALVQGGYGAQEILDAFVSVYGERALMAPRKEGFNLLGWVAPFVALAGGAIGVGALIRRWHQATPEPLSAPGALAGRASRAAPEATADELRRLDAAVREDG